MSLVQRVSSINGIDREPELHGDVTNRIDLPDSGHATPVQHEVSYDVLPQQEVTRDKAATPAYKVSTAKRFAQVIVALLSCWSAAGVVFGFAALKPVMINERVYHNLCTEEKLRNDVNLCKEQDLHLNLFYTMGTITANVAALPVGTILDRYGSRLCGLIGCAVLAAGSLLMATSFSRPNFDGYIAGNVLLALGGTFIFVPSFRIANAWGRQERLIQIAVNPCCNSSTLSIRISIKRD